MFPLYHDLVEQAENRRQIVRDLRKEQISKIVKPFSFDERDQKAAREKARKQREQRDEEDRLVKEQIKRSTGVVERLRYLSKKILKKKRTTKVEPMY